ncbi:MAG: hypothetical protein CM1200mP2_29550 [Planctomycetaceae bacterium]|nr:MAG: hypothetical protein CM1200mP2_29550 [Planctomycetaceae bacterium]
MIPVADLRKSLPNGKIAAQYLPEPGSFTQRRLKFYNASDKSITFRVRPTDTRPIAIDRIQGRDAGSARVQGRRRDRHRSAASHHSPDGTPQTAGTRRRVNLRSLCTTDCRWMFARTATPVESCNQPVGDLR